MEDNKPTVPTPPKPDPNLKGSVGKDCLSKDLKKLLGEKWKPAKTTTSNYWNSLRK